MISSNFDPLLKDIRSKLGSNWTFYQECLDAIVQTASHNQDTIAWLEQMNQLVQGKENMPCSHEGVLFLLSEKGIVLSGQPRVGEVKVSTQATSIPSRGFLPPLYASSPLPCVVLAPSLPFAATPVSTMRKQPKVLSDHMNTTPFDFTSLTPLSFATSSPRSTRHFTVLDTTQTPIAIPAGLDSSANPVFFTDPNFQRDVEKFFGVVRQCYDRSQAERLPLGHHDGAGLVLAYVADEDDLHCWRKRLDMGSEVRATIEKYRDVVLADGKEELDGLGYGLLEDTLGDEVG